MRVGGVVGKAEAVGGIVGEGSRRLRGHICYGAHARAHIDGPVSDAHAALLPW